MNNSKNCKYCRKEYSTIFNKNKHEKKCSVKPLYEKEVEEENIKINSYKEEIERLKLDNERLNLENKKINLENEKINLENEKLKSKIEVLEKYAKKPTTTINKNYYTNINIVGSLEPIDFDEIRSSMASLSNKYIDRGIVGFTNFLCDYGCNRKLITTDYSRNIIAYRTRLQKFIKDAGSFNLLNTILDMNGAEIVEKALKRLNHYKQKMVESNEDDDAFDSYKKIHDLLQFVREYGSKEDNRNVNKISQLLCDYGVLNKQSFLKEDEENEEDKIEVI